MKAFKNLLLNELTDMYDSEHRIASALPKWSEAARSQTLQRLLRRHVEETREQVVKLELVFALLAETPEAKNCPAMAEIIEMGNKIVGENKKSPATDAAIIAVCQKVEHYEIASYGALRGWAESLGFAEAAEIIEEIFEQEKEADHALNELAAANNRTILEEVTVGAGAFA